MAETKRQGSKGRGKGTRTLDFRSDTLTQPTDAMRKAMAEAEVGDDVYGEDPTVERLQRKAAAMLGTSAALFFPTGTMANQAAIWVHSGRQGAIVCEDNCHIALYEGGAAALLSNVLLRTAAGRDGTFAPKDVERHFPPPHDAHFAQVKAVCIENTHNYTGGRTWSLAKTRAVRDFAQERGARFHIDGARLFNAALAQRTTAARLAERADSIMVSLSKGLSAPVGSMLCGPRDVIEAAHAARKILGGGMRQAGHMAAAGLVALETMVDRLADDHANARRLAEGLAQVQGLAIDLDAVETNMVMVDVSGTGRSSASFIDAAKRAGVLCLNRDAGPTVRFVTHRGVSRGDCDEAVQRLGRMLRP